MYNRITYLIITHLLFLGIIMKKTYLVLTFLLTLSSSALAQEINIPPLPPHSSETPDDIIFIKKNILDLPAIPGKYRIGVDYLHSLVPFYADFDGEKWSGKGYEKVMTFAKGDYSKINYYVMIKK